MAEPAPTPPSDDTRAATAHWTEQARLAGGWPAGGHYALLALASAVQDVAESLELGLYNLARSNNGHPNYRPETKRRSAEPCSSCGHDGSQHYEGQVCRIVSCACQGYRP